MCQVNEYTYDEISVGHEEAFQVKITETMMEQFLQITGDSNPLHRDAEYAVTRQYADKVVYGIADVFLFLDVGRGCICRVSTA